MNFASRAPDHSSPETTLPHVLHSIFYEKEENGGRGGVGDGGDTQTGIKGILKKRYSSIHLDLSMWTQTIYIL